MTVGLPARVRVDASAAALPGRVEHIARRTEFTPRYLFSEKERATLVVRVRVRVDDARERLRAVLPESIVETRSLSRRFGALVALTSLRFSKKLV